MDHDVVLCSDSDSDDVEEDKSLLVEEAHMPLEELLKRYGVDFRVEGVGRVSQSGKYRPSPNLIKTKKVSPGDDEEDTDELKLDGLTAEDFKKDKNSPIALRKSKLTRADAVLNGSQDHKDDASEPRDQKVDAADVTDCGTTPVQTEQQLKDLQKDALASPKPKRCKRSSEDDDANLTPPLEISTNSVQKKLAVASDTPVLNLASGDVQAKLGLSKVLDMVSTEQLCSVLETVFNMPGTETGIVWRTIHLLYLLSTPAVLTISAVQWQGAGDSVLSGVEENGEKEESITGESVEKSEKKKDRGKSIAEKSLPPTNTASASSDESEEDGDYVAEPGSPVNLDDLDDSDDDDEDSSSTSAADEDLEAETIEFIRQETSQETGEYTMGTSQDDDDDDVLLPPGDTPGIDSGTTACVAVIHAGSLYVANAGDSRCVLCRNGKAVDLSVDHKPEDTCERTRIEKAGGKVTLDGRVNGGLNLSRALGDHFYKRTANMPLEEQMITPLPDIRVEELSKDDQFMVIACDGIWNSLTSDEVIDFVNVKLKDGSCSLKEICESLCDRCLAGSTVGDGTGCDNMTVILVRFNHQDTSCNGHVTVTSSPSNDQDTNSATRSNNSESSHLPIRD